MARRRMTIKRIDPWSVLKFGFLANLTGLLILLLASVVAWYFVRRLEIVESVCEIARDVSIQQCGVDGRALFELVATVGALGAVVLTGIFVFLAFLANLISDLTGGIELSMVDDTPTASTVTSRQEPTKQRATRPTRRTTARDPAPAVAAEPVVARTTTEPSPPRPPEQARASWPGDRIFGAKDREPRQR